MPVLTEPFTTHTNMRTGYAYSLLGLTYVLMISLPAVRTHFVLKDKFVGDDFYSGFQFETFDDPTHGRVNYVDQDTAMKKNLTQGEYLLLLRYVVSTSRLLVAATDSKFFMRADSENVVKGKARGRDSVRISSWNAYDEAVIVLDLQHMPEGCATWPAFWTLSQKGPWPNGGEIDIVEGASCSTCRFRRQ